MDIIGKNHGHEKGFAIIPTGEVVRTHEGKYTQAREKNDEYVEYLTDLAYRAGFNLYVPSDENLMIVRYGFSRTHSPEQKAQMIYSVLLNPKITDLYFTGGNGTEDVVLELNKLDLSKVPARKIRINIYGMSDATHLLNFLGQRGLANLYICEGSPEFVVGNVLSIAGKKEGYLRHIEESRKKLQAILTRTELNEEEIRQKTELERELYEENIEREIKAIEYSKPRLSPDYDFVKTDVVLPDDFDMDIKGVLIPSDLVREYNSPSQIKLVKGRVNFIADELQHSGSAMRMKFLLSGLIGEDGKLKEKYKGRIVFCLSANSELRGKRDKTGKVIEYIPDTGAFHEQRVFKEWCIGVGISVIEGLRFGHHSTNYKESKISPIHHKDIIPVFAEVSLETGHVAGKYGDHVDVKQLIITNGSSVMPFMLEDLPSATDYSLLPRIVEATNTVNATHSGGMAFFNNYNISPKGGVVVINNPPYGEFNSVQGIEIVLKEFAKLGIGSVKKVEIRTEGFDFNKEKEVLDDVIGFIAKNQLRNLSININGEREYFSTGNQIFIREIGKNFEINR